MAKETSAVKNEDDRTLAILTHILGWLTGFLGPLIIFLVTKDDEVKTHAKNALNWQFSYLIYFVVSFILIFVLVGFILLLALGIINIIFCIVAAVKASNGEKWNYPLSIPFFSTVE